MRWLLATAVPAAADWVTPTQRDARRRAPRIAHYFIPSLTLLSRPTVAALPVKMRRSLITALACGLLLAAGANGAWQHCK